MAKGEQGSLVHCTSIIDAARVHANNIERIERISCGSRKILTAYREHDAAKREQWSGTKPISIGLPRYRRRSLLTSSARESSLDKALQETIRGLMEKARAKLTAAEDWLSQGKYFY